MSKTLKIIVSFVLIAAVLNVMTGCLLLSPSKIEISMNESIDGELAPDPKMNTHGYRIRSVLIQYGQGLPKTGETYSFEMEIRPSLFHRLPDVETMDITINGNTPKKVYLEEATKAGFRVKAINSILKWFMNITGPSLYVDYEFVVK